MCVLDYEKSIAQLGSRHASVRAEAEKSLFWETAVRVVSNR
jgi:hypothetical protein